MLDVVLSCLDEIAGSALMVATHDARVADRMRSSWMIEGGRLDVGAAQR